MEDYWSTNPLMKTPIFSKTMSRNRFRQILTYIHFANNANTPTNGMIPWRGRLTFKTYNPSKITKYGILIRMLCDSATGYISSFKLYCGVGQSLKTTIMKLLRRSFGEWHHLYMENLYNSVALAKELLLKQVRICGKTGRAIQKPRCIFDYNQHVKGVDRADQYLGYYPIFRKTLKWSKKVSLYLFNCGLFNAFKVYKHMNGSCDKTMAFRDFLLRVAKYWIQDRDIERNITNHRTPTHHHQDAIHRLSGN
ncbi:piggyBac transposable element-derived protein 4-like [Polistes fuscatus]|uniref:piggyBac transposable element-derived protein 4-like n=1 Tax=Polistes fuscatus TaxID=30207 RepID=UPI001CA84835|nr:piggyBac transposable element-derived protein 4-like [Polistes fuscatus]